MHGQSDRGIALVIALMTILLVTAMGAGLVMTTSSEALIASGFRGGQQALYAADAAAEWAVADLEAAVPDWSTLIDGSVRSWFVDGAASGTRALPDGSVVDLTAVFQANAAWRPYAFGPLKDLMPPSARPSPFYVVVLVAPDSAADRLHLRTEAFGPRGAHRVLEIGLSRSQAGVRFESWREVR